MNIIYGTDGNVYKTSISNGKEYMSLKKEKEEFAIDELEKIKAEIGDYAVIDSSNQIKRGFDIMQGIVLELLDERIAELKGEKYEPDESELNDISAKNGVLDENAITKEEVIQWIPTSEKQPEHTGDYLVTMGINYDGAGMFDCIRVASYNTCFGWGLYEKNDIHTLFGEITAWAELPKIYS